MPAADAGRHAIPVPGQVAIAQFVQGPDRRRTRYSNRRRNPCGSAPRSRMRAENLHHAATAVVVRDRLGRVYVHRRTTTKDVYPGRRDFAAGGVLTAGEDPHDAAVRELAEELGVTQANAEAQA